MAANRDPLMGEHQTAFRVLEVPLPINFHCVLQGNSISTYRNKYKLVDTLLLLRMFPPVDRRRGPLEGRG